MKSLIGEKPAEEAKSVFEKYKESVGSIRSKREQAEEILESKSGLHDEKKKEEAKKTKERLTPIYTLIELLEQRNFYELVNDAMKLTYKELITEELKKA